MRRSIELSRKNAPREPCRRGDMGYRRVAFRNPEVRNLITENAMAVVSDAETLRSLLEEVERLKVERDEKYQRYTGAARGHFTGPWFDGEGAEFLAADLRFRDAAKQLDEFVKSKHV
jgi:hypothetical protein